MPISHIPRLTNYSLRTDGIHCETINSTPTGLFFNPFPYNDTFSWVLEISLLKTLWEKEKLLVQAISPFLTTFSTLSKAEIIIFVTISLSSANAFNLVWSKILLCGNGLNNDYRYVVKQPGV